eukprot:4679037-Prymnesium_polylepis.1
MKVRVGLFHTPAEPRRGGLPCNICGGQRADALHALSVSGSAGMGSGTRRRSWCPTTRTHREDHGAVARDGRR